MVDYKYLRDKQIVYVVDDDATIKKAEYLYTNDRIERIMNPKTVTDDFILLHYLAVLDNNENEVCNIYGSGFTLCRNVFTTFYEAYDFLLKREDNRYKDYLAEIKTLKDLLEFPIKHSFSEEDGCRDGLIVKAYQTRAKEILGIELDEY